MRKTFQYHKPAELTLPKIQQIREASSKLSELIDELAPVSRERSIAQTKLEETNMWAIKAVVCNDPESVVQE